VGFSFDDEPTVNPAWRHELTLATSGSHNLMRRKS
jgi:hypothetical protein